MSTPPTAPTSAPPPSLLEALDAFETNKLNLARRLLEEAGARGDPMADGYLGMLHWLGKAGFQADAEEAVKHFRRAAHAGDPLAQVNMALAHLAGVGAARDDAAARDWLDKAAAQDCPPAWHQLGRLAAAGRGEPADQAKARDLWRKAAEQGYAPAMRAYGATLADHHPVEALAWLYAAAGLAGDETAAKEAKYLAARMRAKDIAAAHRKGRALARKLGRTAQTITCLPYSAAEASV